MDDDTEFFVPPEKDLTGTVFSNPAFFRYFPGLNHSNVMRYFEESPFYESSTLNASTHHYSLYYLVRRFVKD